MVPIRFITLDPGHFHAVLVQKDSLPGVEPRVHIYAPLGSDLLGHLARLVGFNTRAQDPTAWEVEVHAGPDFLERFTRDKPGNVVVLAGRNARKIDYLEAAINAGLNVLADKPWILVPEHLPRLQKLLDTADQKGLIAYDIMTERYEITSILQGELLREPAIFGRLEMGSPEEPGVHIESVHFLKKQVAGAPLRRPAWFFDVHQQGEGLSDVGTHLVDLIPWMLYPGEALEPARDLEMVTARRWPTRVSRADFQQITGESTAGDLDYFCNTQVVYRLRGSHVKLDVLWGFEAEPGAGDTHLAIFRGSKSRIEVRQGKEEKFRPELYVVPGDPTVAAALTQKIAALQTTFPGIACRAEDTRLRVEIPEVYRTGHEAHFGEVARQFLKYVRREQPLPAWEKPNMLAKYFVTTTGVALSRNRPG